MFSYKSGVPLKQYVILSSLLERTCTILRLDRRFEIHSRLCKVLVWFDQIFPVSKDLIWIIFIGFHLFDDKNYKNCVKYLYFKKEMSLKCQSFKSKYNKIWHRSIQIKIKLIKSKQHGKFDLLLICYWYIYFITFCVSGLLITTVADITPKICPW